MFLLSLNPSTSHEMWLSTIETCFLCFTNMYHIHDEEETKLGEDSPMLCVFWRSRLLLDIFLKMLLVTPRDGYRKNKEKTFLKSSIKKTCPQAWRLLLPFFHFFDLDSSFFNSGFFFPWPAAALLCSFPIKKEQKWTVRFIDGNKYHVYNWQKSGNSSSFIFQLVLQSSL